MTNKATKRALLTSVLSLVICLAMLIGTTFAWFTDSVVSGKNTITAGNLDVELEYTLDPQKNDWKTVEGATDLFNKNALWEPGHAEVVYLRLSNKGTLDLKYQFSMNIESETTATSVEGNEFKLSTYLKYGFAENDVKYASREEAIKDIAATVTDLDDYSVSGVMNDGESKALSLVVYMPETVGNEANYRGDVIPAIELGLNLIATQVESESDSFGIDYDKNAPWVGGADTAWYDNNTDATEYTLYTAEELAGLAKIVNGGEALKGKTVKLGADIDLNNARWTPIGIAGNGFSATFDGQGYTVYNLNVEKDTNAGLFGYALNGGNVKNLNVENAYVKANDYAGAVMGRGYTDIDNCHVKNATVITTPYLDDKGVWDGGAKAGGVIGQLLEGAGNTVTNCSATDVNIYAFRDLGGVVGMVHSNNSASGNTASNVTLGYILFDMITADKNENAGAIYGRVSSSATVSPAKDSAENQSFDLVYAVYDVNTLTSLANYVNGGRTFNGEKVVMIDDVNLGGAEWTPIGRTGATTTDFSYAFRGTFDGQGHTVSNFKVNNSGWAGLFGVVYKGTIKNVTVEDVVLNSNRMTGSVVGQIYGSVDNCHVVNANITVVPNPVGASYDNGDKVGGVVGWLGDNGNNNSLTNCSAKDVTITAYRDLGGIAGYVAWSSTVENNNVENATLTSDQTTNHYGDKDRNVNAIWGRNSKSGSGVGVNAKNNTDVNVTIIKK